MKIEEYHRKLEQPIKDAEIKVQISVSVSEGRKNDTWNERCYALKRETRTTVIKWRNQKITRKQLLKVRKTYRSKCKDRKK